MVERHHGRISVDVHDESGHAIKEPLHLYLSENVPKLGPQYKLATNGNTDDIGGTFPVGTYSLQVFAAGYDVHRETVYLSAGHVVRMKVKLTKRSLPNPSLKDRLKIYGLETAKPEPIHVTRGKHVLLNYKDYAHKAHFTVLHPKSIADVKRWFGSPALAFAGEEPRFGPIANRDISAAAREYVYGNAEAVTSYVPGIEEQFLANIQLILFPIFFFSEVVIDDGATLSIGNGSSVFFADVLTIHKTGVLQITGAVRSDIGLFQQL